MTPGFPKIPAPCIQSMSADQQRVDVRPFLEKPFDANRQLIHVLSIVKNGNPLPVLVSCYSREALEHFVAFDSEAACGDGAIRQQGTPNGVRV